ncbi:hypothetical protein GGR54DRAFT_638038 [Hypoxylon sp. NC1633]|nr:hypothetical protein GGR54DRAFT_638038 [Hypoxylon sp. NC1633]
MKSSIVFVTSLLLSLTGATPALLPRFTNGTDDPDIAAVWDFLAYSDGACSNEILNQEGNTSSGCQNLARQAVSYQFQSGRDPQTGATFTLFLYSSQNCQTLITSDDGKNGACNTVLFESYQVLITS